MSISTRRKTNFVDPETQISLLKRITFHWVTFLIANSIALLIWMMLFEQDPGTSRRETFYLFLQRYAPFLIVSAAMLPVFLRDTIKLSNKFAGPIQRLRRAMEACADGAHVNPISFRKGDFMQGIASDFNQVLTRHQILRDRLAAAESAATRAESRDLKQTRETNPEPSAKG